MHFPEIKLHPTQGQNAQIEVFDFEYLHARRDSLDHNPGKPHRVEFNLLFFFEHGSGSHFVDFHNHTFGAGDILFIKKGQIHAFDLSSQARGKIVLFTEQYIQQVSDNVRLPILSSMHIDNECSAIIKLTTGPRESFINLLIEVQNQIQLSGVESSLIVSHLFAALLLLLNREMANQHSHQLAPIKGNQLKAFFELLERRQINSRNAADYAEKLPFTYKTLNQHCKTIIGKTAKQIIDLYTILEIRRRLVIEDISIQAISDAMGFDEVTNFVKYFKKHTGSTPAEFRKTPKVRYLPY